MADLDDRDTSLNGWGGSGFGSGGVGAGSGASLGGGGGGGGGGPPGSLSGIGPPSGFGGGGGLLGGGFDPGNFGLSYNMSPWEQSIAFLAGRTAPPSKKIGSLAGYANPWSAVDPRLITGLAAALAEAEMITGKRARINDAYRTAAHQAGYGPAVRGKRAGAGKSWHQTGMAADISAGPVLNALNEGLLGKYGLTRPAGLRKTDPFHVQLSETGPRLAGGLTTGFNPAMSGSSFGMPTAPTAMASLGQGIGPPAGAQATGSPVYSSATPGSGTAPGSSVVASAAPTYSDAQAGSWLGNLLGKAASGAQAYGAQYVERATSPENVAKFARQNPTGAMQLASTFSKGGEGAGPSHPSEGGKGYTTAQNNQFKSKLAEYVKKKTAKPQDKSNGKKKPFIFKTPETKFPRYTQSYWLKNLRFS